MPNGTRPQPANRTRDLALSVVEVVVENQISMSHSFFTLFFCTIQRADLKLEDHAVKRAH